MKRLVASILVQEKQKKTSKIDTAPDQKLAPFSDLRYLYKEKDITTYSPLAPDALEPDVEPIEPDPPILWPMDYPRRYEGYPLSKPFSRAGPCNGESGPYRPTPAVW